MKKIKFNKKEFQSFEIVIGTDNVTKFIENIGFFGKKTLRQNKYLEEPETAGNPNVDTVPKEIWDIYRPKNWAGIGRKLGYSIPKGLRSSINYAPSRQKLMQIAELDRNDVIHAIAKSDIFWDEIVFMELLEGNFDVYDITVPKLHNFIANDIIVHNSYSAGIIAEEIALLSEEVKKNLAVLFIDTMGIYWSMTNTNEKDRELLKKWKLKPQSMPVKFFIPKKHAKSYEEVGVNVDGFITLPVGELSAQDWTTAFGFTIIDPHGIAIERAIKTVKDNLGDRYSIDDIIDTLENDKRVQESVRNSLVNRFIVAKEWGIFEKDGTPLSDIFKAGTVTIMDVSHFATASGGWSVKGMLVGLLSRKIYDERLRSRKLEEFEIMTGEKKTRIPMIWIMIDEAHMFLPNKGITAASDALLTLIKQGREPGVSLLMITQRPNKLNEDALAQSDLVISHRLTAQSDIKALRSIMQTYVLDDILEYINSLPRKKGTAIVLDDNSERIYRIQMRPRLSWHAGGSPSAIKKKGLFD